ncbi:MAG: hypothetical protein IKG59_07025, partial [Firmicutes bacterium]|nr:hypothetical protein [Bacillota bacterium]
MRFYPLAQDTPADEETIMTDYEQSRRIGAVSLGESALFFRVRSRTYYIPYSGISRCFRRVMLVPARMCCGRGELSVENLVITGDDGRELAQIQLPGERAAKELM